MATSDCIKPSYDALNSVSNSVKAFVELVNLIPEEDEVRLCCAFSPIVWNPIF